MGNICCLNHGNDEGETIENNRTHSIVSTTQVVTSGSDGVASIKPTIAEKNFCCGYSNTCILLITVACVALLAPNLCCGPNTLDLMTVTQNMGGVNDHAYVDIRTLPLTNLQLEMVMNVFESPKIQSTQLHVDAAATGLHITPHLVYRYFCSSDWGKGANNPKFYGKR